MGRPSSKNQTDVPPQAISVSSTSDLTTISSDEQDPSTKPTANMSKKRARASNASTISGKENVKRARVSNGEEQQEKGVYCHQCRHRCGAQAFVRCSKLKQMSKNVVRPCNFAFCDNDLVRWYGINPQAIRWEGKNGKTPEGHDPTAEYIFECPCCLDECRNSTCRKKKGLQPLGDTTKSTKASEGAHVSNGTTLLESKPRLSNAAAHTNGSALSYTSVIALSDDSELSELESDERKVAKTKLATSSNQITTPKAKAKANNKEKQVNGKGTPAKGTPKKTKSEPKGSAKKAVKGKDAKLTKKGAKETPKKSSEAKAKTKTEKPKPVKKPEVPVEPPVFEKVDTKLGREEAEQRIMLREYLVRFRPLLSVPERALPPVDDFDRPLTEANVRLFAGAMLDAIRDELETQGGDQKLIDQIVQHREELRYYADLARFAAIYTSLSSTLALRLPAAIVDERSQANDAALRAILDLDENSPAPAWAADLTAGPSRRVGASRIPQSAEVIRMLLAFVERTMSTPDIRGDMEYFPPENEARRKHASAVKKEVTAWDNKKKKLAEARVQCRSAAETKANKELTVKEQHEHEMRVALQNVNLRAFLSRRAPRHEPVGVDLDGRVYYALSPRTIEDDGRPPIGWASGLLVWGRGVPRKNSDSNVEDLPEQVERWTHFGKSIAVKDLIKWVEWRYKKAVVAARTTAVKSPAKPKATPSKKTPLKATPTKQTPKQRTLLEVVIPTSQKRNSITSPSNNKSDDASSTSSGLTPPPTASKEELLALVAPKGYTASKQTVEEQGKEFVRRLKEVAEWLEVLEWKGMGEVA